ERYLCALQALADHARRQGRPTEVVSYLRRLLAVDPLQETAQRALMEALASIGDHAGMTQAYRDFRLRLHNELNTQPDAETTALYRLLRADARERAQPLLRPLAPSAPSLRRLPSPPTPLIGRQREIEGTLSLLETMRQLTLTGTGGVGKTRLA